MEQQKNNRSDDRILPEELELEILTRLPVKSLLRFMSVCKNWKSVITSFSFRKLHRQRHTSSPPFLITFHNSNYGIPEHYEVGTITNPDYYLTAFDLRGKIIEKYTLPISSECLLMINCPSQSKLFCFHCYSSVNRSEKLFSYNPSTRQLFRLPDPPVFSCLGLKSCQYTLGYIPSKDEYKLVILVKAYSHMTTYCEILTFSISNDNFQLHYNEWRYIEVTIMLKSCMKPASFGVFVCKVFFWEACDENGNDCILSFDVETEVFSTFRLPQTPSRRTLLELKDELYVMSETRDDLILYLWKLCIDVKGNKSWTLYKTFNLQNLGFTEACNDGTKFDWKIFIYRLEYLQCYNDPSNAPLLEMGMLKLENDVGDAGGEKYFIPDGEYCMPNWRVNNHTNLFTL